MVAISRRTMYENTGPATLRRLRLLDVPQEDDGRHDYALEIASVGRGDLKHAGGHVRHALEGLGLDFLGDCLLSGEVGRGEPLIAQRLDLGVLGPAEPRVGTVAAERRVERGAR